MNYFKRHIGDYHKKAGRLSMLEHGAYTLLMDACYDRERFPTEQEAIDWCWARTAEEVEAVRFVLAKFFSLQDGLYIQQRIQDEITHFHEKSSTNREIALEREAQRRTKRARNVDDSSPDEHESAPNHKPITNNQEPVLEEANASLSGSAFPPCPHQEILKLYAKHLPYLPQPRVWEGARANHLRARWVQAAKPSSYSPEGYATQEEGLQWWDSFFEYVAGTKLSKGFESNGRSWKPDITWMVKAENFAKIIEQRYE